MIAMRRALESARVDAGLTDDYFLIGKQMITDFRLILHALLIYTIIKYIIDYLELDHTFCGSPRNNFLLYTRLLNI